MLIFVNYTFLKSPSSLLYFLYQLIHVYVHLPVHSDIYSAMFYIHFYALITTLSSSCTLYSICRRVQSLEPISTCMACFIFLFFIAFMKCNFLCRPTPRLHALHVPYSVLQCTPCTFLYCKTFTLFTPSCQLSFNYHLS